MRTNDGTNGIAAFARINENCFHRSIPMILETLRFRQPMQVQLPPEFHGNHTIELLSHIIRASSRKIATR